MKKTDIRRITAGVLAAVAVAAYVPASAVYNTPLTSGNVLVADAADDITGTIDTSNIYGGNGIIKKDDILFNGSKIRNTVYGEVKIYVEGSTTVTTLASPWYSYDEYEIEYAYKVDTIKTAGNGKNKRITEIHLKKLTDFSDVATITSTNATYTGNTITPNITLKRGSTTLTKNTDYTITINGRTDQSATNAGTYTVTIKGAGKYLGLEHTVDWKINPITLADADLSLSKNSFTYNGAEQKPTVTVSRTGVTFQSSDYTISGDTKGKDAKTYTVTVTGDDKNVKGTISKTWTISPYTLTSSDITKDKTTFTYNGAEQSPNVSISKNAIKDDVTIGGTTKATNAGSYEVTITGNSNVTVPTASQKINWIINPFDVKNATVTLSPSDKDYTGSEQTFTPAVKATLKNGEVILTEGTDYTVSNNKNTDAGIYDLTVTGKDNFTGTNSSRYKINQIDPTVTAPKAAEGLVYTEKELTLVTGGKTNGGTMLYAVTTGSAIPKESDFKSELPKATGSSDEDTMYKVWWYVKGDNNYRDTQLHNLSVTISKESTITIEEHLNSLSSPEKKVSYCGKKLADLEDRIQVKDGKFYIYNEETEEWDSTTLNKIKRMVFHDYAYRIIEYVEPTDTKDGYYIREKYCKTDGETFGTTKVIIHK